MSAGLGPLNIGPYFPCAPLTVRMEVSCYILLFNGLLLGVLRGFETEVRPILKSSCLKCDGGEKVKGKVDFSMSVTEADADAPFRKVHLQKRQCLSMTSRTSVPCMLVSGKEKFPQLSAKLTWDS